MNIECRSAAVDDVNFKQRIITVMAVPYEQESAHPIEYRGELWNEVHHRGAYRGVDLSAGRVPINVEHDTKIQLGKTVAIDAERPDFLLAQLKIIDEGELGERYLRLAADDAISASVGFYVKSYADQRFNRKTRLREINRAFLDHIGLVGQPAYAGAKVLDVRGQDTPDDGAPVADTPFLDELLADPVLQWVAERLTERSATT